MKIVFLFLTAWISISTNAQSPIGKWKIISHISTFDGQSFDSQKALLQSRPCAANIVWEINADGTFRQNLENSGCDDRYKKIQTKLYSQTVWKLTGDKLFIGGKERIGHNYGIRFFSNKMILTGTEGEGVITYQKL